MSMYKVKQFCPILLQENNITILLLTKNVKVHCASSSNDQLEGKDFHQIDQCIDLQQTKLFHNLIKPINYKYKHWIQRNFRALLGFKHPRDISP